MKYKSKIKMGRTANDTVSGFKGTVTSIIFYIEGPTQIQIQPCGKDRHVGARWFDEGRIFQSKN